MSKLLDFTLPPKKDLHTELPQALRINRKRNFIMIWRRGLQSALFMSEQIPHTIKYGFCGILYVHIGRLDHLAQLGV